MSPIGPRLIDRVVPYRPHPGRSFGEALRRRVLSLGTWWRSSLTVRVVSLVMAAGLASMLAAGGVIVSQVRSQLFDRSQIGGSVQPCGVNHASGLNAAQAWRLSTLTARVDVTCRSAKR